MVWSGRDGEDRREGRWVLARVWARVLGVAVEWERTREASWWGREGKGEEGGMGGK